MSILASLKILPQILKPLFLMCSLLSNQFWHLQIMVHRESINFLIAVLIPDQKPFEEGRVHSERDTIHYGGKEWLLVTLDPLSGSRGEEMGPGKETRSSIPSDPLTPVRSLFKVHP